MSVYDLDPSECSQFNAVVKTLPHLASGFYDMCVLERMFAPCSKCLRLD